MLFHFCCFTVINYYYSCKKSKTKAYLVDLVHASQSVCLHNTPLVAHESLKQSQHDILQMIYIYLYLYIYMGSSSVLVLIGSHSLCNSFVVNQFLFFHTKWRKFPLLTQEAMRAIWWRKKMFCLFFISKIYSHVTQKWWPKTGIVIPYYLCWKLLYTRRKYSNVSNLFAKLQHAKAPES